MVRVCVSQCKHKAATERELNVIESEYAKNFQQVDGLGVEVVVLVVRF